MQYEPIKLAWKGCCHVGRLGTFCLNCTLALVACVQMAVALLVYFQNEIPVPQFALNALREKLAQYGMRSEAGQLYFDLAGRITIRDLRFYKEGASEPLGESDTVIVDLDVPMLFIKRVEIEELSLRDTHLYLPGFYSGSGVSETIVSNLNGDVNFEGDAWNIERLFFRFQGLPVYIKGRWPEAGYLFEPVQLETPVFKPQLLDRYLAFCRKSLEWRSELEALEAPVASVTVDYEENAAPVARLSFTADGYHRNGTVRTGPIRLEAPEVQLPDIALLQPLLFYTDQLSWQEKFEVSDLVVSLHPRTLDAAGLYATDTVSISAGGVNAQDILLSNLVGTFNPSAYPNLSGRALAYFGGLPLQVDAAVDLETRSGALQVDSLVDINKVVGLPQLARYAIGDVLDFMSPVHLKTAVTLGDGFEFGQADFSLDSGPVSYRGARFNRVSATGLADRNHLQIDEIGIENPEYRVTGSMETDFATGDYRLLLSGGLYPQDINPFMDKWWDSIWEEFSFASPMEGDVDVQASWKTNKLAFYFGRASGRDITYRSLKFDRLYMMSYAMPGLVELFDVDARRPEGSGTGTLRWLYAGPHPIAQMFDLETEFEIHELAGFLGKDVEATVKDFDLTEAPRFKLTGALYTRFAPWNRKRDLHLHAETDAPLHYLEYPLDNLAIEGHLTDKRFDAPQIEFGFAGGKAQGSMTWRQARPDNQLDFVVKLTGARQTEAFRILGWSTPRPATPHGQSQDTADGILDLNLSASGIPGDFLSFEGFGDLTITQARLGEVHLFGGLSRALYGTWVAFTTLKLDTARGEFELRKNLIDFQNLTFSGPNSVIHASGDLVMPGQNLDFRVRVYYLDNKEKPLQAMLGTFLKPLGNALELRLWGTWDEPRWRFQLDPRNVFSNPVTLKPEEKEEKETILQPLGPGVPAPDS